jgi:Family of unknown function (DUF5678)
MMPRKTIDLQNKLLTDFGRANYDTRMIRELNKRVSANGQFVIEELPADPEWTRRFERYKHNMLWWNDHAMELEVFKKYRGRYLAVAEGELFIGDNAEEVERLALEKHPHDIPFVHYIPREKAFRIYASRR